MPRPKRASKPDGALRLGEFLCFAVYSANHAFNRVYKPLLDELCEVVGVRVHVVAVPGLARTAVAATVMGDDTIAM